MHFLFYLFITLNIMLMLLWWNLQGEKMVMVACGWRHTISVSSSGGLYTYGWSKYGQLGHGDFADHLIPHQLEALQGSFISQVISFSLHCNRNNFIFCFLNLLRVKILEQ